MKVRFACTLHYLSSIGLLMVLVLFSAFPLYSQSTVNSQLTSGIKKIEIKDYSGAIRDLSTYLVDNPENTVALTARGNAYNQRGQYTEALADIDKVIKVDPLNTEAILLKADILNNQRKFAEAIVYYNQVMEQNPSFTSAITGKARALNSSGNTKEAFKVIEEAIRRNPLVADFYYTRSLLQNFSRRYTRAIQDFDQSLQLGSSSNPSLVYISRGLAKQNLGDLEAAEEDFTSALQIEPLSAAANHSRGLVNYELGRYQEAIRDFTRSLEIMPNNQVTFYNLGMAYLKSGDRVNACINFHKACDLGHTNACKMIILECS
jgi:tetratricopeptide (TPR) repeat protein